MLFLVSDAVRANKATKTASNCDVDNVVKEWLRTSGDRAGGRRQRENNRILSSEITSIPITHNGDSSSDYNADTL